MYKANLYRNKLVIARGKREGGGASQGYDLERQITVREIHKRQGYVTNLRKLQPLSYNNLTG